MNLENLFRIVNYAYQEVPYYRTLIPEPVHIECLDDFKKLPLIQKKIYIEQKEKMLADEHNRFPLRSDIEVHRTSGSTGNYLRIYWNSADSINSLRELWLNRKNYYDILPSDKYCYFYTTDYADNRLINEKESVLALNRRSLGFSKNDFNEERIKDIYKRMQEFKPKYILTQPSIANLLANIIEINNLPRIQSIQYIELSGEILTNDTRKRIEDAFQCKVCNQYGCNEANCIASERNDGLLHIHSSNVYVEIIKDGKEMKEGEYGDLYITSLTNHAMPFIRYKIGDTGRIVKKDGQEVLELVKARVNDYIIDENNERIPAYILLRPIEYINEHLGNIIYQFQVTQNDINDFMVKLAVKPNYIGWKKTIQEEYIKNIKQPSLKKANWKFEIVNHLFPDDITGKLAYFHNCMNGGKL